MLCQSSHNTRYSCISFSRSATYTSSFFAYQRSTMSSRCRCLRTSFVTGIPKLLIAVRCATVSDRRQRDTTSSHPNNKYKRRKVNAASSCCSQDTTNREFDCANGTKTEIETCYSISGPKMNSTEARYLVVCRGSKTTFDFAYCRAFETLHSVTFVFYTANHECVQNVQFKRFGRYTHHRKFS